MKLKLKIIFGLGFFGATYLAQAQFVLFGTETTTGVLGGNTSLYGGIQQYNFTGTGGSYVSGPGLAASSVHDPQGLRARANKLFVGNRWGNQTGLGSIQEFDFDGAGLNFVQDIAGNGLQRTHGLDVNPVTGELVAVNAFNAGASRFTPSGSSWNANGMWNGGDWRDILFSADGTKAYVTELNSTIRIIDVATGTSTTFGVSGASSMHQMAWLNGSIYVTAFNSSSVHKLNLDSSGNIVSSSFVLSSNSAIGIAFSPDGQEMFVSGHTSNEIYRYLSDGTGGWTANGSIATGHNMGSLAVIDAVPEPSSMALIGAAGLALLRRKRSK